LDLDGANLVKDNDVATALFRIVQEALTNVVRYAQASAVRIALTQHDGQIVLRIQDNGVGFDATVRASGVGLVGMRERCSAIGGSFAIDSGSERGTTIVVRVPLNHVQAKEETA